MSRVLILGGTTEGAALAAALADTHDVISSLAGRTRQPRPLPGTVRVGGFGGADGLARYLADEHIDALVDATHPYAVEISQHAVTAAESARVPRVVLTRPEWRPVDGDRWVTVDNLDSAAQVVREKFAHMRAFLAVGSGGLAPFTGLKDPLIRVAEARDGLPGTVVIDRGPFTEAADLALMKQHGIGVVVSKNAGGNAAYAKIAAARALGIPVVMVARPPLPPGPIVSSIADAVRWLGTVVRAPA